MKSLKFVSIGVLMVLIFIGSVSAEDVKFHYQGRVKVSGTAFTGTGQFKFAIVNNAGDDTLWSNDSTSVGGAEPTGYISISVTDGIFNVLIGDTGLGMSAMNRSIFNHPTKIKLKIWFNDGIHGFEKLNPDHELVNVDLLGTTTGTTDYTIYVNGATGDDDHSGLSASKAKKTIQGAVNIIPAKVSCNITIDITDGIYREAVNVNGIVVDAGKLVTFLGDDSWTPSSPGDPAVRITGTDSDISPSRVRSSCLTVRKSAVIKVIGIHFDYASSLGAYVTEAYCVFEKCKATNNGPDGGFCFSTGAFGGFNNCTASYNDKHGFQVANCSSVVTNNSIIAKYNGITGFLIGKLARASIHGTGDFSNNTKYGMVVSEHSQAAFDYLYTGTMNNNGNYGLVVQYDAFTINHTANTFSSNGTAATFLDAGGATYALNAIAM